MEKKSLQVFKESYASLRAIIDASPARMFWKDSDRRFVGVNKAFLDYYGFASENELIGKTDEDIGWNEDVEGFKEMEIEVLQKGIAKDIIGRCLCHGEYRSIHATKQPLFENGVVVGLVGVFQDITELVKYQNDLKNARDKAEAASLAKSRFLSNMSHEIRTPLSAILGLIEMQKHVLDDKATMMDYLEKAEGASKVLLSLVNDILDMSAIENHKMKLAEEVFSLKDLVFGVTDIYYPLCKKKNIVLSVHCFNITHELFIGDQYRIQQIILNLLSNACKFTPENGSITFDVGQLHTKDSVTELAIKIADTGCGMSEEFMQRIFGDFEQEDPTTTRKYGGSGLGLAITKNLTELMGGSISVQSVQGKGSIFTLSLPLKIPPNQQMKYSKVALSSVYILFIEPDLSNVSYISRVFDQMGVRNDICISVEEALARCGEQNELGDPYTYCLVDDVLDGYDLKKMITQLRTKLPKETPVTLFVGGNSLENRKEAETMGITSYLSKPLFASTLYDSIVYQKDNRKQSRTVARTYNLKGMSILVVEDNELNTFIAKNLLEQYGATVDTAENGLIGCEKFLSHKPGTYDAILMDIQMPLLDGYEATKKIRSCGTADCKTIPIIALTANVFLSDVSSCLVAGMNAHVSKPLQPQEIYNTLVKYKK